MKKIMDIDFHKSDIKREFTGLPQCFICKDEGVVVYYKEANGAEYEFARKCTCIKGQALGQDIKTIPTELARHSANSNFKELEKQYPKEVEKAMKERFEIE